MKDELRQAEEPEEMGGGEPSGQQISEKKPDGQDQPESGNRPDGQDRQESGNRPDGQDRQESGTKPEEGSKRTGRSRKQQIGWKEEVWEWVKIIVSAALIAFVLNTFIIANSEVPSGSMENTIMTGDRVIGSRLSYRLHDPERGDIAIFRFPDNEKIYYVKRVIGLPGETVDIIDGKVYVNDVELDEPYLREAMIPEPPMHFEVPEDSYFMMGDNRNYSLDARRWENTYVKREKLIAKVLFRYFPKPGKIE